MEEDESLSPLEEEFSRWIDRDRYIPQPYRPMAQEMHAYIPETITPAPEDMQPLPPPREIRPEPIAEPNPMAIRNHKAPIPPSKITVKDEEKKKSFALTPLDKEYYKREDKIITQSKFILNYLIYCSLNSS